MDEIRENFREMLGLNDYEVLAAKVGKNVEKFLQHICIMEGIKGDRISKECLVMIKSL